jgi:hypothetical protein
MLVKNIWMMNMSKLNSYKTFANDPQTKYLKWYISLIEAANSRNCPQDTPIERHHVFPISIFGRNCDIVNLTVREHILAHQLLWFHYRHSYGVTDYRTKKMALAFSYMVNCHSGKAVAGNTRRAEIARRANHLALRGINNPFYGKRHSATTKRKISDKNRGFKHSAETKKTISERSKRSVKGRTWVYNVHTSAQRRIKVEDLHDFLHIFSDYTVGIPESVRLRISEGVSTSEKMIGRTFSFAHRRALSALRWFINRNTGHVVRLSENDLDGIAKLVHNGYEHGFGFRDPVSRAEKISNSLKGKSKSDDHVNKINRNPDKIEKTAAKHRGMKRSEQTRINISESKKGKSAPNKNHKLALDIHDNVVTVPATDVDGVTYRTIPPNMRKIYHDPTTSDPAKLFIAGHQPFGWVEGRRK